MACETKITYSLKYVLYLFIYNNIMIFTVESDLKGTSYCPDFQDF